VIIWGGRTSAQAGGYAAGREINLTVEDARTLKREATHLRHVSAEIRKAVPEVSAYNSANRPVRGVWPEYQEFRSLNIGEGRAMTQDDEDNANRVVILGFQAARQLYPGKPAVGAQLSLKGIPYTVIAILEKKRQNGSYGSGQDDSQLFVPFSAMARDFPPSRKGTFPGWVNNLVVEVDDPEEHEAAVRQVYRILGRIHHFEADDKDALFVWDTMNGSKLVQRIFDVMTIFFACIAVMTLCLGGIGVMNIMLVSVTERTREIGVLKALGATAREIGQQFFFESVIISVFSGLLGLAIGIGACGLLISVPKPDFIPTPVISQWAILISIVTLSVITMTAGMYPAQRASEMTPVECLRQE
jgi:putative ABC transport system permease protein